MADEAVPISIPIDTILASMREVIGQQFQENAVLKATIAQLTEGKQVNVTVQ